MEKLKKSEILTLLLIAILLFMIPFLSTSLRSTYLYFIFNVLIISLGLEAGFLSHPTSPNPLDPHHNNPEKPATHPADASADKALNSDENKAKGSEKSEFTTAGKSGGMDDKEAKKCLFFIGDEERKEGRVEEEEEEEEEDGDESGVISGQELFVKAESFIGNFYRQLRMQREDSWNRIHGFSPNVFS